MVLEIQKFRKEVARGLASTERYHSNLYTWSPRALTKLSKRLSNLEEEDARVQELQYYRKLAREEAQPARRNSSDWETQPYSQNPSRIWDTETNQRSSGPNTFPRPSKQRFELPANLPDRMTSRNPFINGTRTWIYKQVGSLLRELWPMWSYKEGFCSEPQFPAWERFLPKRNCIWRPASLNICVIQSWLSW